MHFKSWIEISKKNLLHNFSVFKKLAGDNVKVVCVVKANAYGHGLNEVVSVLKDKTDLFAVDSLDEALKVRGVTAKKTILILGYVPTSKLKEAALKGFSFVVYNMETLKKIASLGKKTKIHFKIETGLNRQGIKISDLPKFIEFIKKNNNKIEVEGLSTHFANIEDTLDPAFAEGQLAKFDKALRILKKSGITPKYIHTAASAATILYPKTHFNTIRVGIGLYGLWPSRETKIVAKNKKINIELKPVLSWKSIVAQTKTIAKGETVGYGRTWTAPKDSTIAIIPIGYYDGFDRKLSNIGSVLVKGKQAPVIGRVAMNMFMIDISEIDSVSQEEEVVIVGKSGKAEITIDMMGDKLDRINYEVVSRINPNLPRIIT